nr:hypothetical protein [Bacillus velezensis]
MTKKPCRNRTLKREAPRHSAETEMETLLSDIWQEVLGLDQIGRKR